MAAAAPVMNDKREIFGWTMYDWANSAFSTTVITVFLNPYLTAIAKGSAGADGVLNVLFFKIQYNSFFLYCVSLSVLLQVFILPVLGAIADYSHLRKRMLQIFAVLGATATMLMFFIVPGQHLLGGLLLIIGNLSFGASIVFYNAYLPDIASADQQDRVSSAGFAMGYAGGGLLLLLNLVLYSFYEKLGLTESLVARISLASAGVWWLVFALITFRALRPRHARRQLPPGENFITVGFKQLASTFREIRHFPQTVRYLIAYLFFNDGIQTVIVIAALFATQELGMETSTSILVVLMIQVVAFGGAFFYGWLAGKIGAFRALISSLIIWSVVVVYAYAGMQSTTLVLGMPQRQLEFWLLAFVVAVVLGGSQALSRSLFARMIPPGREAEFFSFYEVSERGTSWMGTALFGLVNDLTRSFRLGILSVIVLFIVGLAILVTVNVPRAIAEAGRQGDAPLQPAVAGAD